MNDFAINADDLEGRAKAISEWYKVRARPFIESNAPELLGQLDSDDGRLSKHLQRRQAVTVCFLGHSGIGKSTLLNALADGRRQVLPSGGIGPLTAKATEVHYSKIPTFTATYHASNRLQRLVFALEHRLNKVSDEASNSSQQNEDLIEADDLDEFDYADAPRPIDHAHVVDDRVARYIKQAKQLVTGDKYKDCSLEYLIDALQIACGSNARHGSIINAVDANRIEKIQAALARAKGGTPYERQLHDNDREFDEDLKAHAAGFLAPLIATIEVGWPSKLLESGVILVDLPGIGIAQDMYRNITRQYVRNEARAVVLVVDRSGPTEDAIDLLRTSGYWDRLVGASDDPGSDPCRLLIAVTKVDDVAAAEWINCGKAKKKREIFADLVKEFQTRMRAQIVEALKNIGTITNNQAVDEARGLARDRILQTLEIHPLSGPEYRRILVNDEEDIPFLKDVGDTGVPALQDSLTRLGIEEKNDRAKQINGVMKRFSEGIGSALRLIRGQWEGHGHASVEAERVGKALDAFSAPKREEYDLRRGSFREYLDSTVQSNIRALVLEARNVAEEDVRSYLKSLRHAHWATLRAAVKRGGTWDGARHIDLPNDIVDRFQEPMAAVWSQRLLKDIRKRTSELALDVSRLVEEICTWARKNGGTIVRAELLREQRERIGGRVEVMRQVGKEAVDELRQVVKQKLTDAIQPPIRASCKQFVQEGQHIGPGVKKRITELFENLAEQSTDAAQAPATTVLKRNFEKVRREIQEAFESWGDPIEETIDIIVKRHEQRIKRSDARERDRVLSELQSLLSQMQVSQMQAASNDTPNYSCISNG